MSDPRYDQRLSDPVSRRSDNVGGMWGWIAGIAVLVLIAIILIAGWNSPTNTAAVAPTPAATTGSAVAPVTPHPAPAPMAHPATPAPMAHPATPATPAPAKR